jgi:hypothetical protein
VYVCVCRIWFFNQWKCDCGVFEVPSKSEPLKTFTAEKFFFRKKFLHNRTTKQYNDEREYIFISEWYWLTRNEMRKGKREGKCLLPATMQEICDNIHIGFSGVLQSKSVQNFDTTKSNAMTNELFANWCNWLHNRFKQPIVTGNNKEMSQVKKLELSFLWKSMEILLFLSHNFFADKAFEVDRRRWKFLFEHM